jgi:hypothetical protein
VSWLYQVGLYSLETLSISLMAGVLKHGMACPSLLSLIWYPFIIAFSSLRLHALGSPNFFNFLLKNKLHLEKKMSHVIQAFSKTSIWQVNSTIYNFIPKLFRYLLRFEHISRHIEDAYILSLYHVILLWGSKHC